QNSSMNYTCQNSIISAIKKSLRDSKSNISRSLQWKQRLPKKCCFQSSVYLHIKLDRNHNRFATSRLAAAPRNVRDSIIGKHNDAVYSNRQCLPVDRYGLKRI